MRIEVILAEVGSVTVDEVDSWPRAEVEAFTSKLMCQMAETYKDLNPTVEAETKPLPIGFGSGEGHHHELAHFQPHHPVEIPGWQEQ